MQIKGTIAFCLPYYGNCSALDAFLSDAFICLFHDSRHQAKLQGSQLSPGSAIPTGERWVEGKAPTHCSNSFRRLVILEESYLSSQEEPGRLQPFLGCCFSLRSAAVAFSAGRPRSRPGRLLRRALEGRKCRRGSLTTQHWAMEGRGGAAPPQAEAGAHPQAPRKRRLGCAAGDGLRKTPRWLPAPLRAVKPRSAGSFDSAPTARRPPQSEGPWAGQEAPRQAAAERSLPRPPPACAVGTRGVSSARYRLARPGLRLRLPSSGPTWREEQPRSCRAAPRQLRG